MGTQERGQRPFNRILFTYAWVIGLGVVIVIVHMVTKSKATAPSYGGGVSRLPLAVQSSSAAGSAAASGAPSTPPDAPSQAAMITATTQLHPAGGAPVYSTNFVQPDRIFTGWPIGPQRNVDIELHPDGYAIVGSGRYVSLIDAPVDDSYNQIEVSVQAKESSNPPLGSGFGIFCTLGSTAYTFDINANRTWSIRRDDAFDPLITSDNSIGVAHGPLAGSSLSNRSVSGVCATLPGSRNVRIAMFVDGTKVADLLDAHPDDDMGWHAGISSTDADSSTSTTTFVTFAETSFGDSDVPAPAELPSPADGSGVQT